MEPVDQLLQDFYGKYGKEPLTPEKIQTIKSTYGDDYDGLINDLYKKYAPDKMPDSAKLAVIRSTYGLSGPESPAKMSDANTYTGISDAANAVSPIGGAVVDLGRTAYSTLVDQVPQFFASQKQKYHSEKAKLGQSALTFLRDPQFGVGGSDFAKWMFKKRHPGIDMTSSEAGQLQAPSEEETNKYAEEYLASDELSDKVKEKFVKYKEAAPEHIRAAVSTEQYIQEQKNEAAIKQKGITQNVTDIHSARDVGSFLGSALGQAAGQIPLSVGTFGASSFLMESSSIYDEQLDLLATKHGISREEVIKRGLDKPAEGQAMAVLAGALDAVSAGEILSLFKKAGLKQLTETTLKKFLKGTTWEGVTEGFQGNLEQQGAAQGAGTTFDPFTKENALKTFNETVAGSVGGGGFSVMEGGSESAPKVKKQPLGDLGKVYDDQIDEVADTGDHEINTSIDAAALQASKDIAALTSKKAKEKTDRIVELSKQGKDATEELEEPLTKEEAQYEARMSAMADQINAQRENAIQERSPAEVPVGEPQGNSPEVVQGVPRPKQTTGTQQVQQGVSETVQTPQGQNPVKLRAQQISVGSKTTLEELEQIRNSPEAAEFSISLMDKLNDRLAVLKKPAPVRSTNLETVMAKTDKKAEAAKEKLEDERIRAESSLTKIKKLTPGKQKTRLEKFMSKYAESHPEIAKAAEKQLTKITTKEEEIGFLKSRKKARAKMAKEDSEAIDNPEPNDDDIARMQDFFGEDVVPDDVDFSGNKKSSLKSHFLADIKSGDLKKSDLKEITPEEFISRIPHAGTQKVAKQMMEVLQKQRAKTGGRLKIMVMPSGGKFSTTFGGIIVTIPKSGNAIMLVPEIATTNNINKNVPESVSGPIVQAFEQAGTKIQMHEFSHDYTIMMAQYIYARDKSFGKEITRIYTDSLANVRTRLANAIKEDIQSTFKDEEHIPSGVYKEFLRYLQEEGLLDQYEKDLAKMVKAAHDQGEVTTNDVNYFVKNYVTENIYGLKNPKEFLAEGMTNTNFMQFLASVPSTRVNISVKGKEHSLLYQLYKSVADYFGKIITDMQGRHSVFDDLMNTAAYYDLQFMAGDLVRKPFYHELWGVTNDSEISEDIDFAEKKEIKSDNDIISSLVDKLELREDIETKEDVKKFLDSVNKQMPVPLSVAYETLVYKKLIKRRQHFTNVNAFKKQASEYMVNSAYYHTNASYRNLINKAFAVDFKSLKKQQRGVYLSGLIELAAGRPPSKQFFAICERYDADQRIARLEKLGYKFATMDNKIIREIVAGGANPATLTAILSKYNKKAGLALFSEIYGTTLQQSTLAESAAKEFTNRLFAIAKKFSTSQKDHVRSHMYGVAYATREAPGTEEHWAEVKDNLKKIVDNTKNKLTAINSKTYAEQTKAEVEEELEIAKELQKSILKAKEEAGGDQVLTKGQLAMYKAFREFATT